MSRFRPVLNKHGVTEQQWRILRVLLDEDGLEPRQLCERCLISSPSIAGVLMRMAPIIEREYLELEKLVGVKQLQQVYDALDMLQQNLGRQEKTVN